VSDADRDAVRAVKRGDREAFAGLVRAYQGRLFGLVLMMMRDRAAAEEVTQDAFVRAFTRLDMYDERRPFYPWIATIAVRLAQNELVARGRVIRREGAPLDAAPEPVVEGRGQAALSDLVDDERRRVLWKEVAALSSGERTSVLLYYRDEMPVGDIARALGVTAGTIKTLLFRARRRLRERLAAIGFGQEHSR
jgi:RNA polymerase sigma-70 factor (ECF subfamily)